jgi:hypothetical protein
MVPGLVVDFWGLIFLAGGGVFLLGVSGKAACRTWFFAGEFVVERW